MEQSKDKIKNILLYLVDVASLFISYILAGWLWLVIYKGFEEQYIVSDKLGIEVGAMKSLLRPIRPARGGTRGDRSALHLSRQRGMECGTADRGLERDPHPEQNQQHIRKNYEKIPSDPI